MRVAALLTMAVIACAPRLAWAQRENAIHVLSFSTKAHDRQAEAITQALRTDVKGTPGWTVLDAPAPFSLLMMGQKCPPVPDNACLVKISDQLKVTRFVWGTVDAGKGGLSVQAHLWENGKGDTSLELALPETAIDPGSPEVREAAHRMARRLVFREGTLLLKVNVPSGQITLDGQEKTRFEGRTASLPMSEGTHDVQVRAQNAPPIRRKVRIHAGETTTELFTFPLVTSKGEPTDPLEGAPPRGDAPESGHGISGTTIAGIGLLVLGAGGIVLGIEEAARWSREKDDGQKQADIYAKGNWGAPSGSPAITDPCSHTELPQATESCDADASVKRASAFSIIGFGVGAAGLTTGIVLLAMDGRKEKSETRGARIVPLMLPGGSGARFEFRF